MLHSYVVVGALFSVAPCSAVWSSCALASQQDIGLFLYHWHVKLAVVRNRLISVQLNVRYRYFMKTGVLHITG
jgi:hypothetical protein